MRPHEGDHFSGTRVTSSLKRPTRRPRPGQPFCRPPKKPQSSPYLVLLRTTLTVPLMSPSPRWALTPPFHPYLSRVSRRSPSLWPSAVCFLWCWCRIAPPGRYPASCPWSPDFPLVKQAQRASTRAPPARSISIGSNDSSFNRLNGYSAFPTHYTLMVPRTDG